MNKPALAFALVAAASATSAVAEETGGAYLLPHPDDTAWWLSGQLNFIGQAHPSFPSAYSGAFSFGPAAEDALSFVGTVHGGLQVTSHLALAVDVESAGGGGLSQAVGLGGFTNLDVVRNPDLGWAPYVARAYVHLVVPLSDEEVSAERGPGRVFTRLPARRLELRAGKLSTVDYFDVNAVGSDSHLQFMSWAVDNHGAYDYAADTRGYSPGVVVEYQEPGFAVRFGELLMPTVANGGSYDFDWLHARGENLELELRPEPLAGRASVVRLLAYWNHARMGSYDEAVAAARAGRDAVPDIAAHRAEGRTKLGFGVSLEQELGASARVFARAGWSDGANESFAFTECDDDLGAGLDVRGGAWGRPDDKLGLALVTDGLSEAHRTYLALGGHGFLLGDGALDYARELIFEAYYTARVLPGVFPALGVQIVENPGYNHDRGPALVGSLRLHVEL
jgi:hypothetical protein